MASTALLTHRETFPGAYVERWAKGRAANARVRELRSKLSTVVRTRSVTAIERAWTGDLADRKTVETIEITYFARPEIAAALKP